MTGAYIRIRRGMRMVNIEIEHLTKEERIEAMKNKDRDELLRWLDMTCEVAAKAEPYVEFANDTTLILHMEADWNSDTIQNIAERAIELGIGELDETGNFKKK